jgi:DNA-binding XRE family transcriptional regulator
MLHLTLPPDTLPQSDPTLEAKLFRRGRLCMGWSRASLARTVLVPEQTILDWEGGRKPIPSCVLSWVRMYIRNDLVSDEESRQAPPEISFIEFDERPSSCGPALTLAGQDGSEVPGPIVGPPV